MSATNAANSNRTINSLASERIVRHFLLPTSFAVLFVGISLAALPYYAGRVFAFRDAMLSNLASRGDNPHGYLLADAALVACGLLLMPVALWFFRVLQRIHYAFAAVGAVSFNLGLAGAIVFGLTGRFEDGYSAVHIYFAYATFLLLATGILILLALVTFPAVESGGGRKLMLATMFQACVLGMLLYLVFNERSGGIFDNSNVLRSVAFCEWLLCALNIIYVYSLANAVAAVAVINLPFSKP